MRLISFDICPFAQRSAIALREKGVAYDVEHVDLAHKPDWFLALSPHGKVPVLEVNGTVLFESNVILEYLDETREPRLHPADPLERARDRAWFSVADALLGELVKMMMAADRDALQLGAAGTNQRLRQLESEVVGPLWRGASVCAMDAVTYPGLQRARWMNELYPELELFSGVPKVAAWEQAMGARPAVQGSAVSDVRERFEAAIRRYGAVHR